MGFVRPYRAGASGSAMDAQIERVVRHIHERYGARIAVADLARIAHLSERQLNRRFQETFRLSVRDFIVRTRIQAASEALLETDTPVAEIAHAHGFYDQSAFTRQFRQHTGETPRVFRRARRRTHSASWPIDTESRPTTPIHLHRKQLEVLPCPRLPLAQSERRLAQKKAPSPQ